VSPRALILNDGHYFHFSGFEEVSTCSSRARLLSSEDFLRGRIEEVYEDHASGILTPSRL
jgi:hypothetical protein